MSERNIHIGNMMYVWRCLYGSVVRPVGVRHRGRLVGSFRGVRHRGRLVGSFRGGDPLVGKVEICQKSFDSKAQIAKKQKGRDLCVTHNKIGKKKRNESHRDLPRPRH